MVPDDPADVSSAKSVQSLVTKCENDPSRQPPIYTYESDINRAAEQTAATVAGLVNAKVTTVVCMCDPIAPAFLTKGLTSQNYFPEFLMPGLGLLDYDKVGRLYDQQQMVHAFGPSHLANAIPEPQQEKSVVAADVGKPSVACGSCGVNWAYFEMVGTMLQMAGPTLTPLTIERAVMANPFPGGDANYPTYRFGPNDYTAIEDAREVHWNPAAVSPIDGNPGAYVPIDGGRRYLVGQWTRDWKVPPPSD